MTTLKAQDSNDKIAELKCPPETTKNQGHVRRKSAEPEINVITPNKKPAPLGYFYSKFTLDFV